MYHIWVKPDMPRQLSIINYQLDALINIYS